MKKTLLVLSFLCVGSVFFVPRIMQTSDAYFEQQLLTVIASTIGLATLSLLFLVLGLTRK